MAKARRDAARGNPSSREANQSWGVRDAAHLSWRRSDHQNEVRRSIWVKVSEPQPDYRARVAEREVALTICGRLHHQRNEDGAIERQAGRSGDGAHGVQA